MKILYLLLIFFFCLSISLLCVSCSTLSGPYPDDDSYLKGYVNRFLQNIPNDFADIFTLSLDWGTIGAEVIVGPYNLGLYSGGSLEDHSNSISPFPNLTPKYYGFGLREGIVGRFVAEESILGFGYPQDLKSPEDHEENLQGTRGKNWDYYRDDTGAQKPFIPKPAYTRIGAAVGLGIGVHVGFNPGEFVDLIGALFGRKIYDDTLFSATGSLYPLRKTKLELDGKKWGELPTQIGDFNKLEELYFSDSKIKTLPHTFQLLKNLVTLNLKKNAFEEIPSVVFAFNKLETLDFTGNKIKIMPSEWGELKKLTWLSLVDNELKQISPEIIQLKQIESLFFGGNQIKEIPKEIGQLNNLRYLSIECNQLEKISSEIGKLTHLTYLDMWKNHIRELPVEMESLVLLEDLNISDNQLTTAPQIKYCHNLKTLNLGRNKIEKLPEINATQNKLEHFAMNKNRIKELPPSFFKATKLKRIWLADNQIIKIPTQIGQLTGLNILDLRNNLIQEIPAETGNIPELESICLGNNKLVHFPKALLALEELEVIDLSSNNIKTVPKEIINLKKLRILDLRGNPISENEIKILRNLLGDKVNFDKEIDYTKEYSQRYPGEDYSGQYISYPLGFK